jgi:tight adherence protein C
VNRALAAAFAALSAALVIGAIASGRAAVFGTRSSAGRLRRILRRIGTSSLGLRVRHDRLAGLQASTDSVWSTEEWVGAKIALASTLFAVASVASNPVLGVMVGVLAWRAPEIAMARGARRRVASASSEMPLLLDLLSVSCAAGVAPRLAVRLALDPLRGPLASELAAALQRADLGGRWRDELAAVARRLELTELERVVAVLGGSEMLGFSLADEMSRLAVDAREHRRARATERARTAPVKMLFPLVFLILPAFLLLTVVPVLLSTVRSIG